MPDHTEATKRLGRRRRANVAGGRRHYHRVKVTPEEEAELVARALAEGVTVARLMVEAALSGVGETPTQRRNAMAELFAIRRDLAGVATNINQLARLANAHGQTQAGTTATLARVRRAVDEIEATISGLSRS